MWIGTPRSCCPGPVRPRLHPEVASLFGALRLRPIILKPRKPESKGQGERTIGFLETSFLPLRSFASIEDLQTQHDQWATEVAFRRYHRRVGHRVGDAWRVEQGFLTPLPNPLPDVDRRSRCGSPRTGSAGWVMSTIRCLPACLVAGSDPGLDL